MKTTVEYFNMTTDKLQETKADSGYSKEECLLLDESYMIKNGYYIKEKLLMTDGRIAVSFN